MLSFYLIWLKLAITFALLRIFCIISLKLTAKKTKDPLSGDLLLVVAYVLKANNPKKL